MTYNAVSLLHLLRVFSCTGSRKPFYMSLTALWGAIGLYARPCASKPAQSLAQLDCHIPSCRGNAFITFSGISKLCFSISVILMMAAISNLPAQDNPQNQAATNAPPSSAEGPAMYKKMSLQELMDQDVTSVARQPEPYGQAPASIDVITSDEIRRSGASSIPEALRLADNLEVAQENANDWAISARGFNANLGNKLLVLIDGRSVYTPLYGGVEWNVQDYLLEDIDRIEVISGPGGTLWGANAVNGVINITTKSAADTQGLYVEGGGGSELRDFGGARYGGTLTSNVFYRVYGKYFDRNSEMLPDGNEASDSGKMGQGGFRIDADASTQNTYTLQGDLYAGLEDMGAIGNEGLNGGNVIGRWSHTFSDDSDTSLQLYYDRTHLAQPFAAIPATTFPPISDFPAGDLIDNLDTYDLDFQHRFHLGERNNIVWGLGYRFTREIDEDTSEQVQFQPPDLDQNLFSGFAQDEIQLHKNIFLTVGSKLEHNDYTGFEYEPSIRLQWNITDKQMVWAAVSRAVRTPSRYDTDLAVPSHIALTLPPPFVVPANYLQGNPNFASETVIAYELGYRAQLGSKISTSVSVYYNDYNNLEGVVATTPNYYYGYNLNPFAPAPFTLENDLRGDTYGLELSADYQILSWWRLHGGYDFLQESIYPKPGQVDYDDGGYDTADPKNQFSIRSSMDLPRNIELDAALRWVDSLHLIESPTDGPTQGTVPSYFELDTRIGWRITKNVELSVVGQNLLHNQHPEYGFPSPARQEIARSVYGKVAFSF